MLSPACARRGAKDVEGGSQSGRYSSQPSSVLGIAAFLLGLVLRPPATRQCVGEPGPRREPGLPAKRSECSSSSVSFSFRPHRSHQTFAGCVVPPVLEIVSGFGKGVRQPLFVEGIFRRIRNGLIRHFLQRCHILAPSIFRDADNLRIARLHRAPYHGRSGAPARTRPPLNAAHQRAAAYSSTKCALAISSSCAAISRNSRLRSSVFTLI